MKASVIDLGFNSVKIVNYIIDAGGEYRSCSQTSYKVRLGEGLNETGSLCPEPVRRTIDSLKIIRDIVRLESAKLVLPVATSAVREAANSDEFLSQVSDETGFRFRVLSQEEEALLSYAGAVGFSGLTDTVFFDLGGGSLEIVRASGSRIGRSLSLPLGALRLSYGFGNEDGTFTRAGFERMKKHAFDLLPNRSEMSVTHATRIVGVGGTLRALVRLDMLLTGYPFNKVHNYVLTYEYVDAISRMLLKMSRNELNESIAIGNRAESVTAGIFVVKALMKKLGFSELTVSARGLRDGALSVFLLYPKVFHAGNVTRSHVESYVRRAGEMRNHVPASVSVFRQAGLVDEHQSLVLGETNRLFRRASQTTDPQALFFSILGEDSLLTHSDQLLCALVAVGVQHQGSARFLLEEYKRYLQRKDRKSLPRLSALFAITQVLETAGTPIKLARRRDKLMVSFQPRGSVVPDALLASHLRVLGGVLNLSVLPDVGPARGQERREGIARAGGR